MHGVQPTLRDQGAEGIIVVTDGVIAWSHSAPVPF